ncbi:PilZ domain-containing protein [Thermodesulfobacteriota bacterium]
MAEKRKEQRTEVDWPIEVFLNDRIIKGTVKNITLNGIFVCCEEPLVLDENYRLSIFPPNHETINVVGKTLWSDSYALDSDEENAPVCIGIVFVKISTIDLDFLKDIRRFSIRNKKSAEAVHPPI